MKRNSQTDSMNGQERVDNFLEDVEVNLDDEQNEVSTNSRRKVIKKRIRNKYGRDTRHMGFEKRNVIN